MRIRVLTSVLALLGIGMSGGCQQSAPVTLDVVNNAAEPIRCTILFGHWIERDAGTIPAGEALPVAFRRQVEDGALYVSRDDGRRMMVENLICGPLDGWWQRRADIPLLPIRGSPDRAFAATCELPEGKAVCSAPAVTANQSRYQEGITRH